MGFDVTGSRDAENPAVLDAVLVCQTIAEPGMNMSCNPALLGNPENTGKVIHR